MDCKDIEKVIEIFVNGCHFQYNFVNIKYTNMRFWIFWKKLNEKQKLSCQSFELKWIFV